MKTFRGYATDLCLRSLWSRHPPSILEGYKFRSRIWDHQKPLNPYIDRLDTGSSETPYFWLGRSSMLFRGCQFRRVACSHLDGCLSISVASWKSRCCVSLAGDPWASQAQLDKESRVGCQPEDLNEDLNGLEGATLTLTIFSFKNCVSGKTYEICSD